jgi:hypothetical protein
MKCSLEAERKMWRFAMFVVNFYVKSISSSVQYATLGSVKKIAFNAQDARRGFAPTISKISALNAH